MGKNMNDVLEQLAASRLRHGALHPAGFLVAAGQVWLTDFEKLEPLRSEKRLRRTFARDVEQFQLGWEDPELRASVGRLLEPLIARLRA